jgi:2-phospho-L-lactate guanylyltransferase
MLVSTWAVVVARTGPTAKSRLAPVLSPDERQELALAMLGSVLQACSSASLSGTLVVTDTAAGLALARAAGAEPLRDPGGGLNEAVRAGIATLSDKVEAALVLPGDVPLIQPADIHAMLAAARWTTAAVVATDRAGVGTNALLLRPPRLLAPRFGEASCARHLAAARALGAEAVRICLPRVALDVDEAEALEAVADSHPELAPFARAAAHRMRSAASAGAASAGAA